MGKNGYFFDFEFRMFDFGFFFFRKGKIKESANDLNAL